MRYSFEDYVIDSDRRELTRSAEPIAVGPKVFDLLLHLVRNREHVVSKDELLNALWAGRIVSHCLFVGPTPKGRSGRVRSAVPRFLRSAARRDVTLTRA